MKNSNEFKMHDGCISCGHKLCAQKVSLFESLDQKQLDTVTALIVRKQFDRGEFIFNQGDMLDSLYIVNAGSIKISTVNTEGKEQILYLLQEGEFIGDLALLKSTEAQFDAVALTKTHVCTISNVDFLNLMMNNKEILASTLAYAHTRINSLERLVQAVSTNEADARLHYLLTQLAESNGNQTKDGIIINLNITREDMANFVGVSRETISRKLAQLNREGVIEIMDQKTIRLIK
jgi:CRP/FNR family transcriptional regulator